MIIIKSIVLFKKPIEHIVAGIKLPLLTESVSIDISTQTSDCEALNNADTAVFQNKSTNTEEVLNNSNITTINQPAEDLVYNINKFTRKNINSTPQKQGTDFSFENQKLILVTLTNLNQDLLR